MIIRAFVADVPRRQSDVGTLAPRPRCFPLPDIILGFHPIISYVCMHVSHAWGLVAYFGANSPKKLTIRSLIYTTCATYGGDIGLCGLLCWLQLETVDLCIPRPM
jgi:hypothetical protein